MYDAVAAKAGSAVRVFTRANGFPLFTLDGLFSKGGAWAGETLAFAHLDVEGLEELVVEGTRRTIARDHPVLTVEVTVHKRLESLGLAEEALADEHTWFYDRRSAELIDEYNFFGV